MEAVKPEQLPEIFCHNLRAACIRSGKSQRALAGEIGASPNSVVLWESGKSSPTLTSVVKLAKALGIPPEALLTEVGSEILTAVGA